LFNCAAFFDSSPHNSCLVTGQRVLVLYLNDCILKGKSLQLSSNSLAHKILIDHFHVVLLLLNW